jgi:polysaccharide export outer membrane protein
MSKSVLYLLLVSLFFYFLYSNSGFNLPSKQEQFRCCEYHFGCRVKPYRLQTNDIISITIKAIDPKLVAMFNPTNEGNMRVNQNQDFIF